MKTTRYNTHDIETKCITFAKNLATMLYMCLKYRVSDFVQWHNTFMENESLRVAAGIKVENILRSHNDRNHLTILYAIDSIEEAENFLNKARTEKMHKALSIESQMHVEYFDVFY